jgi:hypothetical protein
MASWSVVPFHGEIWRHTFSSMEPAGPYTWLAAFTELGTMNILGTIAPAPFTFSPEGVNEGRLGHDSALAKRVTASVVRR